MTDLIDRIRQHITEEGECWNWTGALQTCGSTPTMKYNGKVGPVRRFILLSKGPVPVGNRMATYTCTNPQCVRPDHTGWALRSTVQRRTAVEKGHQSSALRRKHVAESLRKHAKLTAETARQVREAEGPQHVIGARFAISQATVSKIKRGEMWRSYGGDPFAGLGARANA